MRGFRRHRAGSGAAEILRYLGPGFVVTVGFIDPGNWASNVAAGSYFGYSLLWVITVSTLMLIALQHNAAHLGIATGLCLSESATKYFGRWVSRLFLLSAVLASIATALAEVLGAAIGLKMLLGLPLYAGSILSAFFAGAMLFSKSYKRLEKWVISFVSLIGISFIFELSLVKVGWNEALNGWFVPSLPSGSLPIVMSVLGAVVMPHNIFLHSEIIQSRQWNVEGEKVVRNRLRFEFVDTLLAMLVGWAINSTMILVSASVFHASGINVTELPGAQAALRPLLGNAAAVVFGLALVFAGLSSSITAAMAGGSIYAGIFGEPFDLADSHSRAGVLLTLSGALAAIFFLKDPFEGIIWSQIALSVQLPLTIAALIVLTSSPRVMGRFSNPLSHTMFLWISAIIVSFLNVMLLMQMVSTRP